MYLHGIPNMGVETCRTAMEMVVSIVDSQLVLFAVEGELAVLDAVAEASDENTEERLGRVDDILDVVMSLNHVGMLAVLVGNHDCHDGTTIVGDSYFITLVVFQNEKVGLLSIYGSLKICSFQTTDIFWFCIHNISIFFSYFPCFKVIYCKVTKKN